MTGAGQKQRGFTMVEMITVIVILGILAVVAVPRFQDNTFRDRAAADQVIAALRYAQKVAIASHAVVGVTVSNAADGNSNCTTALVAGVINCEVSEGVDLSGTLALGFDLMGRPVPNVAASAVVGSVTITVEAETGYVH